MTAGLLGRAQATHRDVRAHERLLDDLLGLGALVDQLPRKPDETFEVGLEQRGHGVVSRRRWQHRQADRLVHHTLPTPDQGQG